MGHVTTQEHINTIMMEIQAALSEEFWELSYMNGSAVNPCFGHVELRRKKEGIQSKRKKNQNGFYSISVHLTNPYC